MDKGKGRERESATTEGASGSRPPRPYVKREKPRKTTGEPSLTGPQQDPISQEWDDDSDHETDNDSESDGEIDDPVSSETLAFVPAPAGKWSFQDTLGNLLT